MDKPKLSLIMPFFNAGLYLAEALESLQAQSESSWELIAIDDFSEDESLAILKSFAEKDSRIKVFHNVEKGIVPALNLGFSHCQGTYIGRCDADDIYPPERLAQMRSLLERSAPKTVVTGMVSYFSDQNVSRGYRRYEAWLNETNIRGQSWAQVYRECVIASPNWLISREEFSEIGGFKGLSYPEDYDLVFRWYQAGFQVECVADVCLYWREHPLRTSRLSKHYQQKAFFALKIKRFLELESFNRLYLWGHGKKAKICAAHLKKAGVSFAWMDLKERSKKNKTGLKVQDYRLTDLSNGAKLLIGVYPDPSERRNIEDFLLSQNKIEGKDFWYL